MSKINNITIFGAGYVGLTTAVLLSNTGYRVSLIEANPKRLKVLQSGKSFFYEEGVDELLSNALKKGNLTITDSPVSVLSNADVIFSCVGTPDNPDGSPNLQYVFEVAESVAKHAKNDSVFVQKSTVPVGTGQKIEELFCNDFKNILYSSNPEFLREGTAIIDTLNFDRIVVGSDNTETAELVLNIYRSVEDNRDKLAKLAGIKSTKKVPGKYIRTTRNSAELTKVTANAFLALKISFANSIAKLADAADANVNEVMDAVGADKRIGRAFLNAGRGYGGGCFPKDVSGLISSAEDHGVDMPIMTATQDVNESMPGYIANKAKQELGTLKNKKVAVLGLAFKAGTSDARKSPGIKLANILDRSGARVTAYDPHAMEEAKEDLRNGVNLSKTIEEAIINTEAIFVTVDWPDFINLNSTKIKKAMDGKIIVDGLNCLDADDIKGVGLTYIGVGKK